MINNSKNTPPKCIDTKKFINLNLQLQERINNWERERERVQSPFLEENVWQIIKLYKIRWVEKYLKEKCIVLNTKIIKVMLCNRIIVNHSIISKDNM